MIANLKPYPAYKDSSLPWIQKVPAHWELRRGKTIFKAVDIRSANGEEELLTVSSERGVIPRNTATVTMFKAESYVGYKLCWPGDLVINSLWAWARGLGVSLHHGIVSSAYGVYRLIPTLSEYGSFIHYLVRSTPFQWELQVRSKGIWTSRLQLTDESFLTAPFPLPGPDEQVVIVRYLDHVDRRIKRYILAKQKLIKLLEEQKQAIIHQAVTGQIDVRTGNPYPAYKPSGVKWLGEVPEHWEVRQLGRLGRIIKGNGGSKEDEVNEGVPCIRYGDIYTQYRFFIEGNRSYVSPERAASYTPINYGDVLFAASGETIEEIGKSAVNLITIPAVCGGDVLRFTPTTPVDPRFMGYVCDSPSSVVQKSLMGRGFTIMHLYGLQLKYLSLPLPPLPEQTAIARFLDTTTTTISTAREKALREIELFREYRTRLIADVVTGKLDVRQAAAWLVEEAEEAEGLSEESDFADGESEELNDPEEMLEEVES